MCFVCELGGFHMIVSYSFYAIVLPVWICRGYQYLVVAMISCEIMFPNVEKHDSLAVFLSVNLGFEWVRDSSLPKPTDRTFFL